MNILGSALQQPKILSFHGLDFLIRGSYRYAIVARSGTVSRWLPVGEEHGIAASEECMGQDLVGQARFLRSVAASSME